MPRPKKQRVPTCPITRSDYDGKWHGYLNVGKKPNGKDDIRHRSGITEAECIEKILKLEDETAATGKAPDVGLSPKLKDYLRQWYADGMRPRKTRDGMKARWKYSTGRDYKLAIEGYIIPNAGEHRLDEFNRTSQHLKNMLAAISETISEHAARKAHSVLRSAMSDAEEDDLVTRNIMKVVGPPEVDEEEGEWLTVQEGRAILAAIDRRPRLRSRWLMALALGQRQGECLGLMWSRPDLRGATGDIDLDAGTLTIREKLYRATWRHGCGDPVACVKNRRQKNGYPHKICQTNKCGQKYVHGCGERVPGEAHPCGWQLAKNCPRRLMPPGCWSHRDKDGNQKACPPPCKPDCDRHASTCPDRVGGGLRREGPKTKAGKRTMQMPGPIWEAFKQRKAEQDSERLAAGNLWVEHGYVHTTGLGAPVDPRVDWEQWHALLTEAGVDQIKLHAARHFAVTILLLLKVPPRLIMHILGWSTDQSKRYGHILNEMLTEVAGQLEGFLWPTAAAPEPERPSPFRKPKKDPRGADSSTDHSTGNVIQFRQRSA